MNGPSAAEPVRRAAQEAAGCDSTAVVIGAGMCGLLTARVLAKRFDHVLVVERDTLPTGPDYRPGVPQGRHIHAMLARGADIYEELFPGLRDELRQAGAQLIDCGEADVHFPHGQAANTPSGIPLILASRLLLEIQVRQRTAALDNVDIRDGFQVTGLCFDTRRTAVTGVRGAQKDTRHKQDGECEIRAALIVDTSGRTSKLADWLNASGRPRPRESTVDAHLGYASRIYQIPEHRLPDLSIHAELLHAPDLPRGHSSARIEGNGLIVTLQGIGHHQPPHDENGFDQFVRSLHSPLQDILKDLQPVTPIYRFARTSSRKLAYHRLTDWPAGLIALGDAVCAFNPVYGQGMTVAGIEALILQDHLARGNGFTSRECHQFQRRVARAVVWPWLMATFGDRGWQTNRHPGLTERGAQWFMDQWLKSIPGDPMMFHRFLRMTHLLTGPASLIAPAPLARIVTRKIRRPPAMGQQTSLPH